jgi:type 1 glutamine amidotransferase
MSQTRLAAHRVNQNSASSRLNAALIVGGLWHDMDFARLELLKRLFDHEDIKTAVYEDYESEAIARCDFIISYTCDVTPSAGASAALERWLARGGRWFALHATNSVIRFLEDGRVETPALAPEFFQLLGTQFCAHPPLGSFCVEVAEPDHPLVRGIGRFETTDELYLMETHAPLRVLLDTHFEGVTPRFVRSQWPAARHPVFYIRDHGDGMVLYLTLGHCRGPFDMAPISGERRPVVRCSWDLPVFHELVRRGIDWVKTRGTIAAQHTGAI